MQSFDQPLDESVLQDIYSWVDQVPLSRPKKNFARDFSDAAMAAEIVAFYFPKIVELHNYPSSGSVRLKAENWHVLNRKVLRKLQFEVADDVIEDIASCKPFVIERVLIELRKRIDTILWQQLHQSTQSDAPESDQYVSSPRHVKIRKHPPQKPSMKPVTNPKKTGHLLTSKTENSNITSLPASSVIPVWQYKIKEQECKAKDETIEILQNKIGKMEQLLQLKDLRIEELQSEKASKPKAKGRGTTKSK